MRISALWYKTFHLLLTLRQAVFFYIVRSIVSICGLLYINYVHMFHRVIVFKKKKMKPIIIKILIIIIIIIIRPEYR